MTHTLDRISFWSLFIVIVLLPIFFLPFTKIPVTTSKGLLLIIGLAVSVIAWTAARFSEGKAILPKSWVLVSGLGVVLAFFLSSIFSSAPQMSFFGIMFDVGTFWFMFSAFLLMYMSAVIIKNPKNARMIFLGTIASFAIIFIFQALRVAMPETLSLGVLGGKTGNIFGSWNALGLFAGLISIMSLFEIEFFYVSKMLKRILIALLAISIFTIIAVNFSLAWKLVGIFALIIFVYKISFAGEEGAGSKKNFPITSLIVVMISLLFFMTGQFIGGYVPTRLGVSNVEIGPSLSSTMIVAKSTLRDHPIWGIGPNRFDEAWSLHKPAMINSTDFWNTSFDSGSGMFPTFASTVGIIGILALLVFLVFFIMKGIKALSASLRNDVNMEITAFFIGALYLFAAAFFYSTGMALFLLSFAFTGIFIGLYSSTEKKGQMHVSFAGNHKKGFFFTLLLVAAMILSAGLSFKYFERFASISYFGKTLSANTINAAEVSINKALSLYSNDLYLRTYSQVYLLKLNSLASKGASITEAEKGELQASFDNAVQGALLATKYNPGSYLNYRTQGSVYETAGILRVDGAYDKALEAYQNAANLNPLNPGIKLDIARVYIGLGKIKEAKDAAKEALSLKANYGDAFVVLSQVARLEGDNALAISYAEKALALSPGNKTLTDYLNSLKNSSSPATKTN